MTPLRAAFAAVLLALAARAAAAPAASSAPAAGFNVILISLGNVGAERMSLYGAARPTTPRLDAWAKDAAVFDTAFTPASWTLPVGVSLFTSLYPYTHGVWMRPERNGLDPEVKTLAELLRARGYRTAAFTGGLDYAPEFNFMRGFETTGDPPPFTRFSTTTAQAREWLAKGDGRPFFLFLHGYDAHCPFTAHPPFAGVFSASLPRSGGVDFERCIRGIAGARDAEARYAHHCLSTSDPASCADARTGQNVKLTPDDVAYLAARYDEALAEEDALVGGFLDGLDPGLLARTLVVVTADHGEMFAKHGRFGRAGTRRGTHYDDVLRVPLMIRGPGFPARRVPGLAQTVDVMPTVLSALGLPVPSSAQGRDLGALLRGEARGADYAYSGMAYNLWLSTFSGAPPAGRPFRDGGERGARDRGPLEAITMTDSIRDEHWKLIRERLFARPKSGAFDGSGSPFERRLELYDVRSDPGELRDRSRDFPAVARDLLKKLEAWEAEARRARRAPTTTPVSDTLLRKARENGYW